MPPESESSDKDQIPENVNEQPGNETSESVDSAGSADETQAGSEDLAVELAKAQATIKDYWDQIVRLNAEIENNRKRAQRDIENAHKYAIKGFVESLLPVSDSMELGLNATNTDSANLESIREGMNMTLNMFMQMLEMIHPNMSHSQ